MKNFVFIIKVLLLLGCVPIAQPSSDITSKPNPKRLLYENYNYEPTIKTVQLSPKGNTLLPAVVAQNTSLSLSFDQLVEEADSYSVKIVNCDKDWRPSQLNALQYLTDYNEFDIINYEFSFDTSTPYVHYDFDVPSIKRSGNYLLIVYRSDNPGDIVITKRLMVVEPLVEIIPTANMIGLTNLSSFNQQINFAVNYPNYPLVNPLSDVSVTIRQNQRDDNKISNLRPTFTRDDITQLQYRYFDQKNTFSATNEFRFFDLRSLVYPGQNVQSVNRTTSPPKTVIATDRPKTNLAYAQYIDNNGQYLISEHLNINGQYTDVKFNLDMSKVSFKENVYLFGEFTDWKKSDEYLMKYDAQNRLYSKEVLLKQGYYEYQYLIEGDSIPYYLEGNHSQAENSYEIFVYYKPFNEQSDLLIGYYTTRRGTN